ncbi:hypothetical protein LZ30DRAFT_711501 [Colletotrichum cereale]|nr:hypothetical protein LZ30DRAFT_711501 [Colletotrichum cereale]
MIRGIMIRKIATYLPAQPHSPRTPAGLSRIEQLISRLRLLVYPVRDRPDDWRA